MPIHRSVSRFYGKPADEWPVLSAAEWIALHDISERRLAVVWLTETEYSLLGCKPWYAITCGVLGATLHRLWLDHLIRLDKSASRVQVASEVLGDMPLVVGRARLTPLGRRALEANDA